MLEVIGAGLPRTGTTSVKVALERLGFGPCYHTFEVLLRPELAGRWLPLCSVGAAADWERVFEGFRSCVDWPASFFWRELAQAYPEAKVVLTVRDPQSWYSSFRVLGSLSPREPLREDEAPESIRPVVAAMTSLRPLFERIRGSVFGESWEPGHSPDEQRAVAAYHRHVAAVLAAVPAERLLVFDVREGWGPLCAFLGVAAPPGVPFPHLNDAASIRRTFELMRTEGRVHVPFTAGG
ncbi:sulfotransferase family protein [Microbispora hainanensis]|uniref:Sulfotransferase family protein n=1 Tax=Microbispora hainanensis TaxID=568844 RepID=A0A544YMF8_9ACTN|nr:sulfotransferase family protein [Microbispora hainanensis]TQS17886.1 sulfotransferase family protein [Microbispora hainanensis]